MQEEELNRDHIFLIDKPLTWTSFDVVKKIRNTYGKVLRLQRVKVGHAGTLDPLASGLLVVCGGKKTKEISGIQDAPKEYTGIIRLGATTPSFDLETEEDKTFDTSHLTEDLIRAKAAAMVGWHDQVPPAFSAKKVDGVRSYQLARKGVVKELKTNRIEITEFEITAIDGLDVHFRIACTKGTYIRSIARDLGDELACGGYLTALRRTRIGYFYVDDAIDIQDIEAYFKKEWGIES